MRQKAKSLYDKAGYKVIAIGLILLIGAVVYGFLYPSINANSYDIQLFQLSDETIRSAKTVEDPVKTELERERVAAEISPSYEFSDELAGNQAAVIDSFFGYIVEVKDTVKDNEKKAPDMASMIASLREKLRLMETNESGLRLTDETMRNLLLLPEERLQGVQNELQNAVENRLSNPLREEAVLEVQNGIEQEIRQNENIPASILPAATSIARFAIKPNEVVDEELTNAQMEQAKASVEPTRILKGQVLVQEGQVVDREVYRQLELAGMTEEQQNFKPPIGLLLFVVIAMGLLMLILKRSSAKEPEKITALLVIGIVIAFSLALLKLISLVSGNFEINIAFLFPTALAGMLVCLLANERYAVFVSFFIAVSAGIMLQGDYAELVEMDVVLYILVGGITGIYLTERDDKRAHLLQASLVVAAVNALYVGFYLLMGQSQYDWSEIGFYFAAALVSGIASGALTIGLLPFFESIFRKLSAIRLIELANPNHPLLKKILMETPGTYHHSVMVANLADASCEAIGANGLLARVGCYYHDIGKTKMPQFFIENQMNIPNPHDAIPPDTSRDIILAHGKQGADILKKHKMPKEIVDIAMQHHGTSLLKFFYHKEKEKNPEVDEGLYRYAGPKPQTKEIAVVSIADSIEAAVRSMKEPTSEKIKNLVDAIVEDKLKDGQFDECDLTMKELKTVKKVMCETLNGTFHTRIEYPK
ncbi:HD family phosphohydrolase [Planomicrobium sp. CPCC 101079]|uniref:HD family phosphohydrolase n=1 Tax=Planomicrobium sp. CPCC 101079 TaxID=2599618 RepID=UPI0011B7C9B1|nr:HD family phosphohydrolase [Planomicrobium sp. CPCC 101079]TWT09095.1 HD family phosphohydrolase [Planomicrobium sp. CPCC 101079]